MTLNGTPSEVSELQPGDLWNPASFGEWAERERVRAFLAAWSAQANHERSLRGKCAWMIFALALAQTLGGLSLLVGIGLRYLVIDADLMKIVYAALTAEIFGLFLVVARYLFGRPLKETLDSVREGMNVRD